MYEGVKGELKKGVGSHSKSLEEEEDFSLEVMSYQALTWLSRNWRSCSLRPCASTLPALLLLAAGALR